MAEELKETITFLADISSLLKDEKYVRIYNTIPEFRQKKADRLRRKIDKAQSIGVWSLWMRMKEQYHLTDDAPFNLSHSGNYVLCSAAPCGEKVGCDIETVGVFREAIARRFFCPEECRDIISCAEEERAPRFYQYWVLKESFIKATRKGMGLGLDTFEFQIPEGASPYLLSQPSEIKETYYFHQYPHSAAKIAVCSTDSKFAAELQIIDL